MFLFFNQDDVPFVYGEWAELKAVLQPTSGGRWLMVASDFQCCLLMVVMCVCVQVFQEHMSGQEHLRKLQEVTHSICLNTHTLLDRYPHPAVPPHLYDPISAQTSSELVL